MKTSSRTVRIFLSSTFRDFAEERDLLVRKVFPELRRKCRERQVELVDVDLRWGITEKEAQQGRVLPICLAEIDRARPYFMAFLGERYGWVPKPEEYDRSLTLEQPWLDDHRGGKSVTELEILHGVLNNPKMAGRAFFYFRDPKWSGKKGGAYRSEGPEHEVKLKTLKDRIRKSGFPVVENYPNPESLIRRVKEDLWRLIDEAYPASEVPDALTLEQRRHEAYGAVRLRMYLGGERYFEVLDSAFRARKFRPVLIRGQSGGGKSALLANWVARWSRKHVKASVIMHHLGCGADAADPVRMATRLMQELARLTGEEFKPESDPEKQLEQLPHWLALASAWATRQGRQVVLVLDGLDKVSDRRHLRWFPGNLPPGVKLVASCLDGEVLEAAKARQPWQELAVKPLTKVEQGRFIGDYLSRFRKSLTLQQTRRVQGHKLSGNPLFLLTVLEELRVFGVHEELDRRLDTLLSPPPSKENGEAPTVDDVFEHVLSRVEGDVGRKVVQRSMEALWASRAGLFQDELLTIARVAPAQWAEVRNALDEALYEDNGRLRFGHDYLQKAVEDRYGLTDRKQRRLHRHLAEYFAELPVDGRVAEELPWQWEQAEEKKELWQCLMGQRIFEALQVRDKYELLAYWVRLGMDINESYEAAWRKWKLSGGRAAETAFGLAAFLGTAGSYSDFAIRLYRRALSGYAKALGPEHPDTLSSVNSMAILLKNRGDYAGAEVLFRRALAGYAKALGPEHPDTLGSVNNLAILLSDQGDYAGAEVLYRRALAGYAKALGPEHPDTLGSVNNLANLLSDQGDYAGAEVLYRRALAGKEKVLGPEHPDTLGSVNNLAILLSDQGDYAGAEVLYRRALAGREKVLGPEHPDTLESVNNLAILLKVRGDYAGAEVLYRRALAGKEKALGPEHPDTLSSVNNLANLLSAQGDYDGAEVLFRRALAGYEKALGPEHSNTLSSVNNLAILLSAQGDYAGAEVLYRRALAGREKVLGPEHPDTLSSVNNLANLLSDQGDYAGAEVLCRRALAGREKVLGPEHPDTLGSVNNLANLLKVRRDYAGAEVLYRRALSGKEKALGPEHPDTLSSVYNLANSLSDEGDYAGAEVLYRRALAGYEKALGPEHPDTLDSVNNLAILLKVRGDYAGAEVLYRRALAGREKALGSEHPDTLGSVNNLAILLKVRGDYAGVEVLYRRALAGREKVLGPEHPNTLSSVNNLANLLSDQGDYAGAEVLCRRLLAGLEKVLGPEHPDTLSSVNNRALLLNASDRFPEALQLLRERAALSPKTLSALRYILACYECLSGNLDEAKSLITEEIAADMDRKETALQDDDLKAIRDFIKTR